jgi:hypothetical protein
MRSGRVSGEARPSLATVPPSSHASSATAKNGTPRPKVAPRASNPTNTPLTCSSATTAPMNVR